MGLINAPSKSALFLQLIVQTAASAHGTISIKCNYWL